MSTTRFICKTHFQLGENGRVAYITAPGHFGVPPTRGVKEQRRPPPDDWISITSKTVMVGRLSLSCMGDRAVASMEHSTINTEADLKAGVGDVVINPPLHVPLAGYYYERKPAGVHDGLHAKALILDNGRSRIAMVACDLIRLPRPAVEEARSRIDQTLGIPPDHVLITATHSHTGPQLVPGYVEKLGPWIAESVVAAAQNPQPAQLQYAEEEEPSLPHNRRYLMKDGTVVTNPGFLNPDVVRAVGPVDPRLAVLTAETASGRRLMTWVNYALHQDTVGGDLISADFSGFMARDLLSSEGPGMLTIFTIGAAANINHWDVRQPGPQRGLPTAKRIGEMLSTGVRKGYTHLRPVDSLDMRAMSSIITLPLQVVNDEDIQKAKEILSSPPPPNVDFTLERVRAMKIKKVHDHREHCIEAEVQALTLGPLAFVGIPGELFVELGMEIIKASPFPHTFILELANQDIGYIPTEEAFKQGAYEPTSSILEPGAGEKIVAEALRLLEYCRGPLPHGG